MVLGLCVCTHMSFFPAVDLQKGRKITHLVFFVFEAHPGEGGVTITSLCTKGSLSLSLVLSRIYIYIYNYLFTNYCMLCFCKKKKKVVRIVKYVVLSKTQIMTICIIGHIKRKVGRGLLSNTYDPMEKYIFICRRIGWIR